MKPALSRAGRRTLLTHSVPHFSLDSGGIACCVAELHVEWESNPQPVAFIVTKLYPWATRGLLIIMMFFNLKLIP